MRLNNGYSLVVSGLTANIFPASRTPQYPNHTPNLFIFVYIISGNDKKVNSIETDRLPLERSGWTPRPGSMQTLPAIRVILFRSENQKRGKSREGARRVLPLRSLLPCGEIQLHCTGSSTAMTVLFSELFSTQTEPPWSSAISHTSDSPSPAPPYSRLRDLSTRKKGWKMLR